MFSRHSTLLAQLTHLASNPEIGKQSLRVFPLEGSANRRFVNVDTTSFDGINRAERLGFVGDKLQLVDVIFTGILPNVVDKLYTDDHKAVLFTIVRHPVDRAVSTFYYLRKAHWESSYSPEWQNMTIMEYTKGYKAIEENWMVRWLSNKPQLHGEQLTEDDLEKAKMVLREQVWVGVIDKMEESMERFGQLFGWNRPPLDQAGNWDACMDRWVRGGGSNKNKHRSFKPDDEEYKALAEINKWDMRLYEYALEIFDSDGKTHFANLKKTGESS